ncbi:MAG: MATE family efflux transporter [Spirochaetaceae bacterium]|jgi:putative MATE family efflux protein|nr:MATE family efflux transporter [Spirochaetaceae bacterium]
MTKNLTVGDPALLIVGFTIPLLIGNLFQQFYNMADAFIVGRTIGVQALAAVGCTGSVMFFILGFVWGFTQGASIIASQCFGAGDYPGVRRSFAVSIVLGIGVTLLLTGPGVFFARPFLILLNTPAEILDAAYRYMVVIFWGIAAAVMFNLISNIMRAVGDSRTPLVFLVIACVINIILDYVFILVFHTGVEGAAYATVIAQVISGLLCVPVILKRMPVLRLTREDWRFTWSDMSRHIRMAFPMGFQMSIIAIGAIVLQFALNGLGTAAVAAYTAAQKIDMVAGMPMNSFGLTMTTYVAQNYGARRIDRIRQGLLRCLIISGAFSILIGIVFILMGHKLAAFFIAGDPAAVSLAHIFLRVNGSCYLILSILLICRQSLQGLGNSLVPTIAGFMELVMRSFAGVILARYFGFIGVCFANPLAWLGAAIPLLTAVVLTMKRLNRVMMAERRLPG